MHEGHRNRLYTRFLEGDPTLTDVETVELLLCYSIARIDVKPIARELIDIFGSVRGVIEAPVPALLHVKGMGKKSVVLFKIFGKIMNDAINQKTDHRVGTVAIAVQVLRTVLTNTKSEKFAMLLLAKDGKLLDRILFSENLEHEVNVNMSEIILKTAQISPHAAIIGHNHPSGYLLPSEKDDTATKKIAISLGAQKIKLLDHIFYNGQRLFQLQRKRQNG